MVRPATLAFDYLHSCLLYVGTPESPDRMEWQEYLRFAGEHALLPGKVVKCLVVERGPGPNAAQRKAMQAVTEAYALQVAVLTGSLLARGIVTALSWVKPGYRAFQPDRLPDALHYLGLDETEARAVEQRVAALIRELDAQQGSAA